MKKTADYFSKMVKKHSTEGGVADLCNKWKKSLNDLIPQLYV